MRDVTAGDQGVDIALVLEWSARIGLDQRHQGLVDFTAFDQAHRRYQQALIVNVGTIGAHAESAEIDQVRGAGHEAYQFAPLKAGLYQHEIV